MDIHQPLNLLGGLTAAQFMQRHWQRKPLLVRGAVADTDLLPGRADTLAMAELADVESRLVSHGPSGWQMRHGPFARRQLPALSRPQWTLLVQGVDLHHDAYHHLLQRFRFVPDARLDDAMVSFASDGGGVGPHVDSYDVFLLQTRGQRRWRIGRQRDLRLVEGAPLRILASFEPQQEFVLDPGDMLYLPPRYAHEGVAVGECMTCSIGFRAPRAGEIAQEVLQRVADDAAEQVGEKLYGDREQPATATPAAMPDSLVQFARAALEKALADPDALARSVGEAMTEPKAQLWFEGGRPVAPDAGVALDRGTRMLYDTRHVFINGESFRCGGADARLMRLLADRRYLEPRERARLSRSAAALLQEWCEAGWLQAGRDAADSP